MVRRTRPKRRTHRPAPHAIDERANPTGLRSIAVLEAVKGIAVLAVGFGLFSLVHKDVGDAAEGLVHRLHMNPARHISRIFIEAADKITDTRVLALAFAALAYSTVRFVEAYGLWNRRVWAEWFALLSGSLYLPWEIYEVAEHPSWFHFGVFTINVAIILYMVWIRWSDTRPVPVD
jgi:uncharacterized membrane protein (DUF2068 family)